jgi:hypothetical protein
MNSWRLRGLLGAMLVALVSCGVSEDEAVRLKEGAQLKEPEQEHLDYCSSLGCPFEGQRCVEVFFEWGRSPALCLYPRVCHRLECKEGRVCAFFDGFPGQVRCIEKKE